MTSHYDTAIIGGGAAGMSAALVLARALRRVVVIDAGEPRNAPARHMHGYLSRDGLPPSELLEIGRHEVLGYGATMLADAVRSLSRDDAGFHLRTDAGIAVSARRVVLATGLRDVIPAIEGVRELWGRDVLHCPYCHGHEVRGRRLGVLGNTPGAVQHALIIRQWSDHVTYFSQGQTLAASDVERLAARDIRVVQQSVVKLVVEDHRLAGLELTDGSVTRCEVVFVRPVFEPNTDLLRMVGAELDDGGLPYVDSTGQTTVRGLWVAGNAGNVRAQVITAAGEGSAAAIAINNDLVDEDIATALAARHAAVPAPVSEPNRK